MFTFIAGEEVKVMTMDSYLAWYNASSESMKPFSSPLAWANENFLYETEAYKANVNGIWETIVDTRDRMTIGPRVAVYRWVDRKPLPAHVEASSEAEKLYANLEEYYETCN